MKIIYDTNFIMSMIKFKIDLFAELELILDEPHENVILDSVEKELKNLGKGTRKSSNEAKLSLDFINSDNFHVVKSPKGNVDDVIHSLADKNTLVATNDIELRKRLKSKGIKTIYLRAKKHLAIG